MKNTALAEAKSVLERDLDEKEMQLNSNKKEQFKSTRKLKTQLSEQEDLNRVLAEQLRNEGEQKAKHLFYLFKYKSADFTLILSIYIPLISIQFQ